MMLLSLIQTAAEAVRGEPIGPVALAFMLLSMGAVTALTVWCFYRVLTTRRHFDPDGTGPAHAPVEGRVDREGGPS